MSLTKIVETTADDPERSKAAGSNANGVICKANAIGETRPSGVADPLEIFEAMSLQERRAFDKRMAKFARMDIRNIDGDRVFPATTHAQFLKAFRSMTLEERIQLELDRGKTNARI